MEYKDPGRYVPIIYLLYSWGSLFGVPSSVPLNNIPSQKAHETVGVPTIMENQMEKKMENEMETGII